MFQPSFRIELFLHKEGHRRVGERLYSPSSPTTPAGGGDPTPIRRGYREGGADDVRGEGAEERREEECHTELTVGRGRGGEGTGEETDGDHS